MEISEKNRIDTYRNAPDSIRELYVSDKIGELITNLGVKFASNFSEKISIEIIGDTILGFYKIEELPKLFQEKLMIGADQAHRMTADLMDFLAPIVEREQAENNIKKAEAHKLADEIATIPKDAPSDTVTEAPAVKPMRTMAGDMNRVHGYGAYREANPLSDDNSTDEPVIKAHPQEDILSGNLKPIADLPKYHEPEQGTEAPTNQPQEKQTEVAQSNRIPIQPA